MREFASSARFLERGLLPAAQDNIKSITERPLGFGHVVGIRSDEPLPSAFARNGIQDRILRDQWVAGKEKLRHQSGHEAWTEQRQMNMRRPPGVRVVPPRIRARLYRKKSIFAFFIGHAAAGASLDQIHIAKASMDDVFFELTGRNRVLEGQAS